jgi:hypothetical protein
MTVWAGRLNDSTPFAIHASFLRNDTWSAALPLFAATGADELQPQLSRGRDGAVWLAFLRNTPAVAGGASLTSALLVARWAGGAWSAPETLSIGMGRPDAATFGIEHAVLAVDRDSAWVAFAVPPPGGLLGSDRELNYAVHSAAGWSPVGVLSDAGLAESNPVLAPGPGGAPVAFFGLGIPSSVLWAKRWNGASWVQLTGDTYSAQGVYAQAAAPDTNGAVRLFVLVREGSGTLEDRIREFEWNADAGFVPGEIYTSVPVATGGGNEPPAWTGLALATTGPCPGCPQSELPRYRFFYVDFGSGGTPSVYSVERTADAFLPLDRPGSALVPDAAYPNGVWDDATGRWYATWTAPPALGGRLRAKFAWTQEFAGDLALGASYLDPDTVRVTVVCTGDATARVIHIYRLPWAEEQDPAPFPPPVPAAAAEIPASPLSLGCPFTVDDFPGAGRWYYYAVLEPEGTFPAGYARSIFAAVVPQFPGGGGGPAAVSALLPPFPSPALGAVRLPFTLAQGGEVRIRLHDLRGRAVRTLALGQLAAGSYVVSQAPTWDRLDDAGAEARSGVYVARLVVDGVPAGAGARIVLLR